MKKIVSLLLIVVMSLSIASCSLGTKDELSPKTDLPEYSEDFQKVLDNVDVAEEDISEFMGYASAAYETYDAKGFCDYVYNELDFSMFDALADAMTVKIDELSAEKTAEASRLSFNLQQTKFSLYTAATLEAAVNADYAGATDESDYESFKADYAAALNRYSDVIYGCELFAESE